MGNLLISKQISNKFQLKFVNSKEQAHILQIDKSPLTA